ncbi:hypothetical protein D3C85_1680630 [compost metagenome]
MDRQHGHGLPVLRLQGRDPLQISKGASRLAHPLIGPSTAVEGVRVLWPRAKSAGEGQNGLQVIFFDLGQTTLGVEQDRVIRIGGIPSGDIGAGLFQIIQRQIGQRSIGQGVGVG